eukprot:jgi/Psemu1/44186/gm1.44186_g
MLGPKVTLSTLRVSVKRSTNNSTNLLEKSDDLLSANLVVQFLDDNVVNNYGKGTGELNPAFKHLQGRDFVFHKPSDLQTCDCFKTSKRGFIPPWVVQVDGGDVAKRNHLNEGKNNDCGSTTAKTSKTGEKEGSNVREEEVRDLAETPIHVVVTLPKFPLKINGDPKPESFDLSVVLKEPDPELMFPLYKPDQLPASTLKDTNTKAVSLKEETKEPNQGGGSTGLRDPAKQAREKGWTIQMKESPRLASVERNQYPIREH